MAKRTIKLNLKLPAGIVATTELSDKVLAAAQAVIDSESSELLEAQQLAKELSAKGIKISAEELLSRKSKKRSVKRAPKAKGATPRKRIVLSNAKRKALIAELKNGETIASAAKKYGISTATVMNIKTAAGLTKKRS